MTWLGSARPGSAWRSPPWPGLLSSPQLAPAHLVSAWFGLAWPSPAQLLVALCPCLLVGASALLSGAPHPATSPAPFWYSFCIIWRIPPAPGGGGTRSRQGYCQNVSWAGSAWPCLDQLHSIQSGLGWLALARPRLPWVGSTRLGPARPSPASGALAGAWCLDMLLGGLALVSGAPHPGTTELMSHSQYIIYVYIYSI